MAVRAGHTDVVQFLLLNQATTDHVTGSTQRTPLHDAAAHGHVAVCYILLQHNASLTATDANGQTPLQLALESASADVVTLLRLAALNKDGADSRCNSADGWIGIHMNDFKSGSGIASTPMSDGKCTPRDLLH
eukprot:m.417547 g.417547  ORF g.417547 m.417547 type:complete len:133 (+) comp21288_c0_seq5:833-1231(+)